MTRYKFTGQELDIKTGLYDYGAWIRSLTFVKILGERFGVNVVWIHTGKGEPYTDFHGPEHASGEGRIRWRRQAPKGNLPGQR